MNLRFFLPVLVATSAFLFVTLADASRHPGQVAVSHVGRYVQLGTNRVGVSDRLGAPTRTLGDGTWLYENRSSEDAKHDGTLLVAFRDGRVSDLRLISPSVEASLLRR